MVEKKKTSSRLDETSFTAAMLEVEARLERFNARIRTHEHSYELSALPRWLELQKWVSYEGLQLILDCDPDECGILFETACPMRYGDLSEKPNLTDYRPAERSELDPDFLEELQFKAFIEASIRKQHRRLSRILERNEKQKPGTPVEWIEFAHKYGVEVPWLDWAIKNELLDLSLDEPDTAQSSARLTSTQSSELPARSETTYLNIIAALLGLMFGKTSYGKSNSVFRTQSDVINALLESYSEKPGIKKRTLEDKFAKAKRSIDQ